MVRSLSGSAPRRRPGWTEQRFDGILQGLTTEWLLKKRQSILRTLLSVPKITRHHEQFDVWTFCPNDPGKLQAGHTWHRHVRKQQINDTGMTTRQFQRSFAIVGRQTVNPAALRNFQAKNCTCKSSSATNTTIVFPSFVVAHVRNQSAEYCEAHLATPFCANSRLYVSGHSTVVGPILLHPFRHRWLSSEPIDLRHLSLLTNGSLKNLGSKVW